MKSTGLDIATRTGVCWIKANSKYLNLDWTFIKFDNTNLKLMYEAMINKFAEIIPDDAYTIIENIYFGGNRNTCIKLGRFNGFVISEAVKKKVRWVLIGASSARSKLGINTKKWPPQELKKATLESLIKALEYEDPEVREDAVDLLAESKDERVIVHLSEALRLQPENADTHNNLGAALARLGRFNEAIAHYSEAQKIQARQAEEVRRAQLRRHQDQGCDKEAVASLSLITS